jgi:4-amino-4-deoxy-L-arabinose transferase-like glycosyltransferase
MNAAPSSLVRTRVDRWIAVGVVVVVAALVGVTAQTLGFTRDEGYYFKAGELYANWWRALVSEPATALSTAGIDKHLSYNPEHPFLLKGSFAASLALKDALGLDIAGHQALRLPAWIVAGLSALFVWLLARGLLPRRGAVVAVLLFVSMPHVFWHMHVACFDVGVTAAHTALVWAWLRFRHTWRGAVVTGIVFGVCAAAKHNVLPVPALFVLHWFLTEARPSRDGRFRLPLVFFCLAFIAPVVYVSLWPYLWPDALGRFSSYIWYHTHHEHYPILYFGDLLTAPPFPWLFPFVMSAVTIPLPVLATMTVGFLLAVVAGVRFLGFRFGTGPVSWRREPEATRVPLGDVAVAPSGGTALLLALNAAYPFVLIALPSTPIFGGTKHWMNALPFLCVLGAWALVEGVSRLQAALSSSAPGRRRGIAGAVVVGVLGVVVAVPGAVITARVWPYGLGSYNELVGFTRGAANVGMQRTFWGYEARAALPAINERTPKNGRIHFGDVNADSHARYARDGLLRKDIGFSNTVRGAAVAHVEPQGEFKQQQLDVWNEWGRRDPDIVLHAEGVPLSTVTFRDRAPSQGDPGAR